jgi:hypothetical protein
LDGYFTKEETAVPCGPHFPGPSLPEGERGETPGKPENKEWVSFPLLSPLGEEE